MGVLSERLSEAIQSPVARYVPAEVRGKDPIVPEGTDLAIWTYEFAGPATSAGKRYAAIAYAGRSGKPLWHYTFRSEDERQKKIDDTASARRSSLESKASRAKERKEYQHGFKVGDIVRSSWGYDQTNVDFYEVVGTKGKEVVVREIAAKGAGSARGADYVVPVPGKFVGAEIRRRPGVGGSIRINSTQTAFKWDGKPEYVTPFGMGH